MSEQCRSGAGLGRGVSSGQVRCHPPVGSIGVVSNTATTTPLVDDDAVPHWALVVHPTAETGSIPVLGVALAGGVPSSIVPQDHWLVVVR